MNRSIQAAFLLAFAFVVSPLFATPALALTGVAVCDPNNSVNCTKPNPDGSINTLPNGLGATGAVVSTATESGHVLKASAGNLVDVYVTTGAVSGYLMVFASATVPGDGAVTPQHCVYAPANSTTSIYISGSPLETFASGISAAFSTTGCFTKTGSATAFFNGRVQ